MQRVADLKSQPATAFLPGRRRDLDLVFALQFDRSVNRDNPVSFRNLCLQLERVGWRATLAGCQVTVHQHGRDSEYHAWPAPAGALHCGR